MVVGEVAEAAELGADADLRGEDLRAPAEHAHRGRIGVVEKVLLERGKRTVGCLLFMFRSLILG